MKLTGLNKVFENYSERVLQMCMLFETAKIEQNTIYIYVD